MDPWAHPPPTAPNAGQDCDKAGDILNFLPVAAAAAAAAVAANGNKYMSNRAEPQNGNAYMNGHEKGATENELKLANGNGHDNGHDLNGTSELLYVAAKLLNGTAAGGGAPPMNGGNGKDPSVSTTQVTIPKDVSACVL